MHACRTVQKSRAINTMTTTKLRTKELMNQVQKMNQAIAAACIAHATGVEHGNLRFWFWDLP